MNDPITNYDINRKRKLINKRSLIVGISCFILSLKLLGILFSAIFAYFMMVITFILLNIVAKMPVTYCAYNNQSYYPYNSSDGANPASPSYMGSKY